MTLHIVLTLDRRSSAKKHDGRSVIVFNVGVGAPGVRLVHELKVVLVRAVGLVHRTHPDTLRRCLRTDLGFANGDVGPLR